MTAIKRRRRGSLPLGAGISVGALLGVGTGVALAANVFFTPGTINAQNKYAHDVRHSYNYAYTAVDHTGCAGLTSQPGLPSVFGQGIPFWTAGCTSGSGTTSGPVTTPGYSGYTYGSVNNPNNSTVDHFGQSYAGY